MRRLNQRILDVPRSPAETHRTDSSGIHQTFIGQLLNGTPISFKMVLRFLIVVGFDLSTKNRRAPSALDATRSSTNRVIKPGKIKTNETSTFSGCAYVVGRIVRLGYDYVFAGESVSEIFYRRWLLGLNIN